MFDELFVGSSRVIRVLMNVDDRPGRRDLIFAGRQRGAGQRAGRRDQKLSSRDGTMMGHGRCAPKRCSFQVRATIQNKSRPPQAFLLSWSNRMNRTRDSRLQALPKAVEWRAPVHSAVMLARRLGL